MTGIIYKVHMRPAQLRFAELSVYRRISMCYVTGKGGNQSKTSEVSNGTYNQRNTFCQSTSMHLAIADRALEWSGPLGRKQRTRSTGQPNRAAQRNTAERAWRDSGRADQTRFQRRLSHVMLRGAA